MNLIQSKVRYQATGMHEPHTITLHHTAGGLKGSEAYLKQKGLGYHFMIAKDGTVYAYNPVDEVVSHSARANFGFIGVSYEAGGPLGPVNEAQLASSIELVTVLANDCDTIRKVSDHASVDNMIAHRGWKSDPQWPGEKSEVNDWTIKHKFLDSIARASGLVAFKYDPNDVKSKIPLDVDLVDYDDNGDENDGGCLC